jgi:glycosyltransferase involved in cell wall biosynthesis
MSRTTLSVVLPVYNEADVIEKVVNEFYTKVVVKYPGSELLIAEDGSTDGTKEILKKLEKEIPICLIMGEKRKGYLLGVKDALLNAHGSLVFYCDTDNTHDPDDLFKLLERINECDLVAGIRLHRNDPLYRIVFSRGYNFVIFLLFGVSIIDTNAGFKLMKREVVDECVGNIKYLKYGFSTELLIRAHHAGYRIQGVPISHFPRKSGKADQFEILNMPKVIFTQLRGLMKLMAELRQ